MCRWFGWSEPDYLDASVMFCDQALAIRAHELEQQERGV